MTGRIEVEGVERVLGNLRRFSSSTPDAAREAGEAAASTIARDARSRVPTGASTGGHAASSVRSQGPTVIGGGSRFPYYPWIDFGGRVGRGNMTFRPFIRSGRYIWRSFAEHRGALDRQMVDSLVWAGRRSGLEVDR